MSARAPYHMDASDTIIYVCQKAQTVPGKGKATPVGIPCVRPQSEMRCYMLDRCGIESGSWQLCPRARLRRLRVHREPLHRFPLLPCLPALCRPLPLQLLSLFLNQLRRREVFYFSVPKICKRQRNIWKKKVLKLKMLRIYLLLKKYMVLIHRLLNKHMILIIYLLKNLLIPTSRHR